MNKIPVWIKISITLGKYNTVKQDKINTPRKKLKDLNPAVSF